MKILVCGMTNLRGTPLATVLRVYGRHSVCGYALEPAPPGGHPDPELRALELNGPRVPISPSLRIAAQEGKDLCIVAVPRHELPNTLWQLNEHAPVEDWPVIIVTPLPPMTGIAPPRLQVGWAPFTFRPDRVMQRLLDLPAIHIRHAWEGDPDVLRQAVSGAWKWVNNMIPITVEFGDSAAPAATAGAVSGSSGEDVL